jgi:predicted DNA repair protein MutK
MVSGAIRTDFILSAEIMAIALAEVADEAFWTRAAILALVAVAITIGVYGLVGLIVKMDDIGLHLAERRSRLARALGRGLVHAMPKVMSALSTIGIAAMIWVGGGIIVHGLEVFGFAAFTTPAQPPVTRFQRSAERSNGRSGRPGPDWSG